MAKFPKKLGGGGVRGGMGGVEGKGSDRITVIEEITFCILEELKM